MPVRPCRPRAGRWLTYDGSRAVDDVNVMDKPMEGRDMSYNRAAEIPPSPMVVDTPFVFGIGLSRTGTGSLSSALNILGWKTIHFPSDSLTFQNLCYGNFNLPILQSYNAITDTPAAAYFAQFDITFPGSKFILTVRDVDTWLLRGHLWYMDVSTRPLQIRIRAPPGGSNQLL
jgi:hypothetical protein